MSRFEAALLVVVAHGLVATSCASGQSECQANAWSGGCRLTQVTKVRVQELPLPSVTLEAVYRPVPNANSPNITAPDVRREFTTLGRYEDALRAHIEARPEPRCYVNPPAPGQCQPGPMVVEVPEFDALRATPNVAPTAAKGCAQIESTSAQDRLAKNAGTSQVFSESFEFAEGTAELPASAADLADAVATRLKQNPNLECIGVVGAWVRGESAAVAFARAREVKDLLVARGVGGERLLALTVDPLVLTAAGGAEPPNPKDRRVTLSVLLDIPRSP
jgi:outer membrane protein OmpA-like peptidoglycan-associated protein